MAARRGDAMTSANGHSAGWERYTAAFERWAPYGLLAVSAILSVLSPEQPAGAWMGTLALVGLAAVWIAVGHTTAATRRRTLPGSHLVYLVGLLGLAAVLMSRDIIFFIFAITGFLHAAGLRPLPLVFVGTGASSFLIQYFSWGGFPRTSGAGVAFVAVLVLQTFLIGFGIVGGEKLTELSEARRTMVAELEASMAENESLHAQLLHQAREAGISEERQRLAREIHDTLAQSLTGVITQLEAADQSDHDPLTRRRHLDNAAGLARQGLTEARRSVRALAPGALEHGRLPDALDQQVRDWSQLHAIPAETLVTGATVSLPTQAEVALLRVAQEALANVGKHAEASRVVVTLSGLDDQVLLDIRDDGCGFDASAVTNGSSFGLISMRQRLAELGGELTVESGLGAGTAISACIPIGARQTIDA